LLNRLMLILDNNQFFFDTGDGNSSSFSSSFALGPLAC